VLAWVNAHRADTTRLTNRYTLVPESLPSQQNGGYQGGTRPLEPFRLSPRDNSPKRAIPAKTAPAMKVAAGPNSVHNQPAKALAASRPAPVIKLNIPNAVPRRSAEAASTTRVESSHVCPYVEAPENHPTKTLPCCPGDRQHDVGGYQERHPEHEQRSA
jgi:hypothetical protein